MAVTESTEFASRTVATLVIPAGGRVVVASDLYLRALSDSSSESITTELARRIDRWVGPGAVVLAGNTFELRGEPNNRPAKALRAHPRLLGALQRFAATPGRDLVILAGDRDRAISTDPQISGEIRQLSGAQVATALDLTIATGSAVERVRIEHGDQLESTNNDDARRRAVQFHEQGYRGYISGRTHCAELIDLDGCFYANPGCNTSVFHELHTRGRLAVVSRSARRSGWVELEAGADLHVELWLASAPTTPLTRRHRLIVQRQRELPVRPTMVASLSAHQVWPEPPPVADGRGVRRIAATAIAAVGVVNIISALTPPMRNRLAGITQVAPFAVPVSATFATAALGVVLVLLAGSVRHGRRRAWLVACYVLAASIITNLLKGIDVEEAVVSLVVAAYLASNGRYFRGAANRGSTRAAITLLAAVAGGSLAASWLVTAITDARGTNVITGFASRLVGVGGPPLPDALQDVSAALTAIGLTTLVAAAWLLLRPRQSIENDPTADAKAWDLVQLHGRGTLDYFALRDDKARFIWGNTVVPYAVRGGVAVVSPDPIGPSDERAQAWTAFRRHCSDNGWSAVVSGAADNWLPVYRSNGMTVIYAGDEAVVDITSFSLAGGRNKALRQAVNRVASAGYRIEFCDPADLDPTRAAQLTDMLASGRRGGAERGFSMTLSRLFDSRDRGLLLAIAVDAHDKPAAFCQFVPAPGIGGYSLDITRRAGGAHPNGLVDFVIVNTIEHLRDRGGRGLALNFATMRAVLAGEVADTWLNRRNRSLLTRLGRDMQIESLWRFNAKYDPTWVPRYVIVDGPDQLLSAALAVASTESLWELPVVGRFLRPATAPRRRRAPSAHELGASHQ
ncbi:MAG: lysyl-tRNA synthetase, class [Ilumatobacteraceae bacterium]